MVLFQRRIIYLPSIPPGTRNESLADDEILPVTRGQLSGMRWSEVEVESGAPSRWLRRTVRLRAIRLESKQQSAPPPGTIQKHVAILYLQGRHPSQLSTVIFAPVLTQALLHCPPCATQTPPRRQRGHASPPPPPLPQASLPRLPLFYLNLLAYAVSPPHAPRPRAPLVLALDPDQTDPAHPPGRLHRRAGLPP